MAISSQVTSEAKRHSAPAASSIFPHRASPSLLVIASFFAVYVIWGSTYFAIRIGLGSFPPLLLAGTRHIGAGVILYLLFRKNGTRPTKARNVCIRPATVAELDAADEGLSHVTTLVAEQER